MATSSAAVAVLQQGDGGEGVGKVWFGLVQEDVEEKERNDYRQGSEDLDFPSYR